MYPSDSHNKAAAIVLGLFGICIAAFLLTGAMVLLEVIELTSKVKKTLWITGIPAVIFLLASAMLWDEKKRTKAFRG